jgi:hypothetical protein
MGSKGIEEVRMGSATSLRPTPLKWQEGGGSPDVAVGH